MVARFYLNSIDHPPLPMLQLISSMFPPAKAPTYLHADAAHGNTNCTFSREVVGIARDAEAISGLGRSSNLSVGWKQQSQCWVEVAISELGGNSNLGLGGNSNLSVGWKQQSQCWVETAISGLGGSSNLMVGWK
ncbi:hypothetical protein J6590_004408 [Homalodisca vitripennis]|nr:hypothetical protein J6590_004408 [Homalodisca vitripennis]